jgi:hypothetical protein
MKKIYSISVTLILSLMISLQAISQSQTNLCPVGATALGFANIPTAEVPCQVFIFNALPNARIEIKDDGDTDITIILPGTDGRTNASGNASIGYQCGRFSTTKYVRLVQDNGNFCDLVLQANINLPIKLANFNAIIKPNGVQLDWTSVFESNSAHFGVEKSNDGKSFTTVGTVKAAGNSVNPLKYSFTDEGFSGTAFYRLKLVDLDGRTEYSKTVYVNGGSNGSTGTLSVFPNPFRSDVQLKGINASDVNKSNIRVFSATGKTVAFKVSGANSISIDPSVPAGVYFLQVKDQRTRLVKTN